MSTYRKKPVVIEAVQFTKALAESIILDGVAAPAGVIRGSTTWHQEKRIVCGADWWIDTLEGRMRVLHDDWIITGVKGEHYPCKPDIFALTYEPVEPALAASGSQTSATTGSTDAMRPKPEWKVGNEFAPFHRSASHVDPSYRDGWNDCYRAAMQEKP